MSGLFWWSEGEQSRTLIQLYSFQEPRGKLLKTFSWFLIGCLSYNETQKKLGDNHSCFCAEKFPNSIR